MRGQNIATLFFRALLSATLVLVSSPAARPEIGSPTKPPPQAAPVTVEVPRGGSVEIPLKIFGLSGEQIYFRIRTQPEHGTLSPQRIIERELSSVTYTHDGIAGITRDGFTYAAQSSAGVSAPASVTIRIIDRPPLLLVPQQMEFGPVVIGRPETRTVEIRNAGGSVAEGTASTDSPWEIAGNAGYRLGPGESATFDLVFDPRQPRGYRGVLRFSSDPLRISSLTGTALAPFEIEPVPVKLETDGRTPMRQGEFTLTNRIEEPQTIALQFPPPIEGPREIQLPPRGSKKISLKIPGSQVEAVSGEMTLAGAGYAAAVPLTAAAPGALLTVAPNEIRFGRVEPSQQVSEIPVSVSNPGGQRAFIRADIAPPFQLTEADKEFALRPGEEHQILVGLDTTRNGSFRTRLQIQGYDQTAEVTVSAEIAGAPESPTPAPRQQTAGTPRTGGPPPPEPERAEPETPREYAWPAVKSVKVVSLGRHECTISWKPPAEGKFTYRIEERVLSLDESRRIRTDWIDATETEIRDIKGNPTATFDKLKSGYPYAVRIIAIGPNGEESEPSFPVRFITQTRKPLFTWRAVSWVLIIVAIAGLIIWKRRGG